MSDSAIVCVVFLVVTVPLGLLCVTYLGLRSKHAVRFDADVSKRRLSFEVTPAPAVAAMPKAADPEGQRPAA